MANAVQISHKVRDILARSVIGADRVELPGEQLDRTTYLAVNKALVAAGGKWNRKAKAHLFSQDPREALGLAIEDGSVENRKNILQAFYTPPELADRLVARLDLEPDSLVLEPSCGGGALVAAVLRACPGAMVDGFDIDEQAILSAASSHPGCLECFKQADFLELEARPAYDAVAMNPPFAKDQDIDHVRHAWGFLKPGGRLAAIMSPGWMSPGSRKKRRAFKAFVDENGGEVQDLDAGAFKRSGTMVRTVMVLLHKTSPA